MEHWGELEKHEKILFKKMISRHLQMVSCSPIYLAEVQGSFQLKESGPQIIKMALWLM